jgi:DNA-directed RNA polymerase omega subunit
MNEVTMEDLMKNVGSRYKVVVLASKRTLELAEGKPKFVEMPATAKLSAVAVKEIAEGKVGYKEVEEEKKAS